MTTVDLPDAGVENGVSVLSWLRAVAEQNQPADDVAPTIIPVAWMGRTSTDDQQDPTLSLPRQLENSRTALPAPFVIVAKFYDIESGRNDLDSINALRASSYPSWYSRRGQGAVAVTTRR